MKLKIFCLSLLASLCACTGFDDRMKAETKAYTSRHCPQKMDEVTTKDSLTYDTETRTYWRHCSIAPEYVEIISRKSGDVRNALLMELMNDASLKECKDENINFGYTYCAADTKKEILRLVLTPKDYSQ